MLYRIIDQRDGRVFRSRNQNGYYDSRQSAERAILQLKWRYDSLHVQQTETNWEVCE